jgi:hypothetical protein
MRRDTPLAGAAAGSARLKDAGAADSRALIRVLTAAMRAYGSAIMAQRPHAHIVSSLRHLAVWVIAPVIVATVVYLGLWQRYERAHAAAERLPAAVAAQLAQLPPQVSSAVAVTFTSAALDQRPSRVLLTGHLRSALALVDAPGLRLHGRALGRRTAAISFVASRGRAGCAAVRFGPQAAVRVAYAPTRPAACAVAERRVRGSARGGQ